MPRRRRRLLPLLLLLVVGPLLLLLPTARADEATVMMAPSSVPPPVSLGGAPALPVHGNENDHNRTNQDNTKAADSDESAVAPPTTAALEARFPSIYGPFIPSRDAVVLKGPAPDVVINPKGAPPADKAGQRGYVYVPTGPQGWYANGYGSNYYSAYPYPPDPYLADSQYYPDYGWDHVHEFPFIYVSKEDAAAATNTAPLIEFVESMGRGRNDDKAEHTVDEAQAAKDEARSSTGAEEGSSVGDKQYYGGGGYPYGGGYGGYGYPSYYSAGFGGYFTKGHKGGGFYANFGGEGYGGYGGYPGYYGGGGCGGGGYGCGGYYRRRLRGAVGA